MPSFVVLTLRKPRRVRQPKVVVAQRWVGPQEYQIFTNGEIEGFPRPVNYFDFLVARAFHERGHRPQPESQSLAEGGKERLDESE